jgi:hypothetical protein
MSWKHRTIAACKLLGLALLPVATNGSIARANYDPLTVYGETGGEGLALPSPVDGVGEDQQYDDGFVGPFTTSHGTLTAVYVDITISQSYEVLAAGDEYVDDGYAETDATVNSDLGIQQEGKQGADFDTTHDLWWVDDEIFGTGYLGGYVNDGGWSNAPLSFWKDTSYSPGHGIPVFLMYTDLYFAGVPGGSGHIDGSSLITATITYTYTP